MYLLYGTLSLHQFFDWLIDGIVEIPIHRIFYFLIFFSFVFSLFFKFSFLLFPPFGGTLYRFSYHKLVDFAKNFENHEKTDKFFKNIGTIVFRRFDYPIFDINKL